MAASFFTPAFAIEPSLIYNLTWEVQTKDLVAKTAFLTGKAYVQFFDGSNPPGGSGESAYGDGWYPGFGTQEVENTAGWASRSLAFSSPTTAAYAMVHLAFAAHTGGYVPDRIHGGSATGTVTCIADRAGTRSVRTIGGNAQPVVVTSAMRSVRCGCRGSWPLR